MTQHWKGTPFEGPLARLKVPGASEAEQTHFLDYVHAEVKRIGRDFAQPKGRVNMSSRQAAERRSIAKDCDKLAARVERFSPPLAECLRHASEAFTCDADQLATLSQGRKRHPQHSETRRILELMHSVHEETGKWHDRELSGLLSLAGLNQHTSNRLRDIRHEAGISVRRKSN
jgi:hypothetical protein